MHLRRISGASQVHLRCISAQRRPAAARQNRKEMNKVGLSAEQNKFAVGIEPRTVACEARHANTMTKGNVPNNLVLCGNLPRTCKNCRWLYRRRASSMLRTSKRRLGLQKGMALPVWSPGGGWQRLGTSAIPPCTLTILFYYVLHLLTAGVGDDTNTIHRNLHPLPTHRAP